MQVSTLRNVWVFKGAFFVSVSCVTHCADCLRGVMRRALGCRYACLSMWSGLQVCAKIVAFSVSGFTLGAAQCQVFSADNWQQTYVLVLTPVLMLYYYGLCVLFSAVRNAGMVLAAAAGACATSATTTRCGGGAERHRRLPAA